MVIHKKGWIRIVEAFVAILLITGVLLILLDKGYLKEDISSKVYEAEVSILRGVQLDLELRRKEYSGESIKAQDSVTSYLSKQNDINEIATEQDTKIGEEIAIKAYQSAINEYVAFIQSNNIPSSEIQMY